MGDRTSNARGAGSSLSLDEAVALALDSVE